MVVRPSWERHLRLSLVTFPVALYPATSEVETIRVRFTAAKTESGKKPGARRPAA